MVIIIDAVVCLLIVGVFCYVKCIKYGQTPEWKSLWEEKESLEFLLPMAGFLVEKTGFGSWWEKQGRNRELVEAVEVGTEPGRAKLRFLSRMIARVILFLLVFCSLSMVLSLQDTKQKLTSEGEILRPVNGGSENVNLHLEAVEDEKRLEKDLSLRIASKKLTKEQFHSLVLESQEALEEQVLDQNESREHVDRAIYLPSELFDTQIAIEWKRGVETPVRSDGSIITEKVPDEGCDTVLTAEFSYEALEGEVEQLEFVFRIYPPTLEWKEQLEQDIMEEIQEADQNSRQQDVVTLPKSVSGVSVTYAEKVEDKAAVLLCTGFLAAGILVLSTKQKLQKQMKKRELQLLMDYPEIMGKFTLLLGAGMTMKGAWMKIVSDYLDKQEKGREERRFAYEEMLVTARELENGITEASAYDNFGRRVHLLPYLKFTTLLVQNMRKGAKGMSKMLEYEAAQAYEERKETAKRIGEEAGTKLLFPMIIMMTIVFAIIMIPAMLQFSA